RPARSYTTLWDVTRDRASTASLAASISCWAAATCAVAAKASAAACSSTISVSSRSNRRALPMTQHPTLREDSPIDSSRRPPEAMSSDEPIRLSAYDHAWPRRFEEERVALAEAIGNWIVGGVHHVGSTAVPGLQAKPIIDILVGARDLEAS